MALKKQHFDPESEIPIFNNALVYVRDGHWQFRMYVHKQDMDLDTA
jgi:hypothetical protein